MTRARAARRTRKTSTTCARLNVTFAYDVGSILTGPKWPGGVKVQITKIVETCRKSY